MSNASAFKRPSQGEIDLKVVADGEYALVSLVPPQGTHRTPSDIVCVIDVSGSMGADASIKGADGKSEANGLSVLDIVKHAVKTIVSGLDEHDRLSIVKFSSDAKVTFPLSAMTQDGRTKALAAVEALHTEGSTNMWDGLRLGMDTLRSNAHAGKNAALFLLTDGQPDSLPSNSPHPTYQALLKAYKDEHGLPGSIHTFGFGYNLNSVLLVDLALAGNGPYAFIPDSTLTGTVFVHALTRVLSTCATELVLSLEQDSGATIKAVLGGPQHTSTSWGSEVRIGSVLFGQSRDFVLKMAGLSDGKTFLRATLKYLDVVTGAKVEKAAECSALGGPGVAALVEEHLVRSEFVDAIREALDLGGKSNWAKAIAVMEGAQKKVKNAKAFLQSERGQDLLKDVEGQATEAVSKQEYFTKWGRHYLPSLMGAHLDQACNNFKDPGVQHYAGKLFGQTRDKMDDIFLQLPPPKPSRSVANSTSYGSHSPGFSPAPVSMGSYYSSAGPCFAGSSQVLLADGSLRRCDQLRRGDKVSTPQGPVAVQCVLETVAPSGQVSLCALPSGLLVTPWHPIRHAGQWTFPADLVTPQPTPCSAVYSFLLEGAASLTIEGVESVSLAHGLTENKVVAHPFWGTEKVAENMARLRGWAHGHVRLEQGRCLERDQATGLVSGLVQHAESS